MTYPIILAHGIARFDILTRSDNDLETDHLNYWKNIRTILEEKNYISYHTHVDWAGNVKKRAEELAEQVKDYIRDKQCGKVNIVAHSMGGAGRPCRHRQIRPGAPCGVLDHAPYASSWIDIC